jgi:hypothetical protein
MAVELSMNEALKLDSHQPRIGSLTMVEGTKP